ncbi:zinc finger protein 2 [Ixodes scapularis]|uniref:zinc finger protein 2 n=1 Tax=Ixodes scapularis TaxID=6945 RepID=UPI001A9FC7FE|nr:zinc finger protein 2 [Ixodes scapularis]
MSSFRFQKSRRLRGSFGLEVDRKPLKDWTNEIEAYPEKKGALGCEDGGSNLSFSKARLDMQQQRTYHQQGTHRCRFCSYHSRYAHNVACHERIHTGERPFHCRFCHKAFPHRSNLRTHEKVHTGEKPFRCQFCQRAFVQNIHLVHHERIHTGERPFQCGTCGKAFIHLSSMTRHERGHTRVQP